MPYRDPEKKRAFDAAYYAAHREEKRAYSAARGAALVAGKDAIKIHGAYVPVRARVVPVDAFSAHADAPGLVDWLGSASRKPRRVMLVHGEPTASDALRKSIEEKLGLDVRVAEHGARTTFA